MTPHASAPEVHHALQACEHLLLNDRLNVDGLCKVGLALRRLNRPGESRKCYTAAVDALLYAMKIGNVDAALSFELLIHNAFVSTIEDDEHYYRCYSSWRSQMAQFGRRFREPGSPVSTNGRRIGFILATGNVLGHTEVLVKMLRERATLERLGLSVRVYVVYGCSEAFLQRAAEAGIEVRRAEHELSEGEAAPELARLEWLRRALRDDDCGVAVWVTTAPGSTFMLSAGLTAVQVFWALRFHPVSGPFIDGYISYGPAHQRFKTRGKTEWHVCPVPLALDLPHHDATEIASVRNRFAEPVLIGTLARAEKIDSKPFLAAVARILVANPQAAYVWTGRTLHPGIQRFFEEAGVAGRCHFVGWVDTALFAKALDVFLESFPLGCGVTGYQALGVGTPLLSYLEENTVFGMQFGTQGDARRLAPDDAAYPVLRARNAEEYVALAGRLIADTAYRAGVGARGKAFFEAQIDNGDYYAARFFETVIAITDRTVARRSEDKALKTPLQHQYAVDPKLGPER